MEKFLSSFVFLLLSLSASSFAASRPNVLWILTDDQRYDSIQAFNRMLHDRDESELGYVESPNVDRLASMGTTFINTFCQAQGCAPSRASMHYGRYPFHSGVYEFEFHNNNAEHCKPTLPERMANMGYQTLHIGKLGVRLQTVINGKARPYKIYQKDIDFRTLGEQGLSDYYYGRLDELDGVHFEPPLPRAEFYPSEDGFVEIQAPELNKIDGFESENLRIDAKFDMLRHYTPERGKIPGTGDILAGVSPQPEGKTRDGYYTSVFSDFLHHENCEFKVGTLNYEGVDPSKPLFVHIGYDFPHTPVFPPGNYRKRFEQYHYRVPNLTTAEWDKMAEQLRKQVTQGHSDHFTDEEKQTMIRDYYAFCAYGDRLVGQAANAFIEYSQKHEQPWMIIYVCGDHGWKLNEHGAIAKFTPWEVDSHNPIIVVASDKIAYPAGKVVRAFSEFVDIAPTVLAAAGADLSSEENSYFDGFDLATVASGKQQARDYVIGESHAVTGPRAYIRNQEWVLSLRTRPDSIRGKDMEWALEADWKSLDPALYHLTDDPHEINNVAFDPGFCGIAEKLKNKLLSIVIGDHRVEVDWGSDASGTSVYYNNKFPDADDKRLEL